LAKKRHLNGAFRPKYRYFYDKMCRDKDIFLDAGVSETCRRQRTEDRSRGQRTEDRQAEELSPVFFSFFSLLG
jgi:hypothetical protein